MNGIIKFIVITIVCLGFLQGCVSSAMMHASARDTIKMSRFNFDNFPTDYKATIEQDFNKWAKVHHPEYLKFVIRRPVKFYNYSYSSNRIEWNSWVSEIVIPSKSVYLFENSDSIEWTAYYVRFSGKEIINIYGGEEYIWLKRSNGFESVENKKSDSVEVVDARFRGAIINGNTFIKFRDDLPQSIED